jgi:CRISPR-associated protein Csx10
VLEIDVRLRQPLSIGTSAANMRRATQRFVPGSAVRGAYAARWLAEYGDYQASAELRRRFIEIFERVGVRFGPLFADGGRPGSLATLRHKYAVGAECAQASWNAAADTSAAVLSRCPDCGQPLEPSRGDIDGVTTTERIRVALDDNETARPGMLFSRESLITGTTLTGHITSDDEWLASVDRLRLGGKRSTSGTVVVTSRTVPHPPLPSLHDDGHVVVVCLAGPGIFVDEMGRPLDRPANGELSRLLGVSAAVERAWVRRVRVGGWHLASGLPKPMELAAQPGSTYRISTAEPIPAEGLRRLAVAGLGLRRNEGFGWVGPIPELMAVAATADTPAGQRGPA